MVTRYLVPILLVIIFSSFTGDNPSKDSQDSKLTVEVDKRMELYFVTAYMSDSFFKKWITVNDANYAKEMESYFAAFKSHPAVTFFEQTWKRDMSSYIPPEIMIYLSSNLEEQKQLKIPQDVIDHLGGNDKKDEFIRNIQDFSKASNFDEFYKLHQDYYTSLSSRVLELMKKKSCISKLTAFYGTEQNHYYTLLVPLLGPGNGYGPSLPAENGKLDVYLLFSPYQNDEQILNMVWHEFGHSFVNPVVARNSALVNERSDLYDPIASSMQPLYSDWENALSEHLVRVNTTELIKSEYGKRTARQHISAHESQGFIYMKPLTELIKKYEKNRRDYPSFESYFPQILDKIKTMEASDYMSKDTGLFSGPMNTIGKNVTNIIVPSNEENDSLNQAIKKYTVHIQKFLQDRFNSEIQIITDKEALGTDLSGGDIMVYGTLNGNLWLKAHIEEFPFTIDADKVQADKTYKGKNLRFISAWPNFQNKSKGMVIYTAQKAEDIWGINGVNHGSTDFIIIKGDKEMSSGDYKTKVEKWGFE